MEKISAVYKIVNTVTGDFYIGSSRDVKARWAAHKSPSRWKRYPNSQLYQDMKTYGVDKFRFQILAPVMPEYLKQVEQELIKMLKPSYNDRNAKGLNVEREKETIKKYQQSEKCKESQKKYYRTEKGKEVLKKSRNKYFQTEKGKEALRKYQKKYYSRLCEYNGETLTLKALISRFLKRGIAHPTQEARKYLKK